MGLTSLTWQGVGPILPVGSLGVALAATTASTGVGALATHNVVKALTRLGIPEAQASFIAIAFILLHNWCRALARIGNLLVNLGVDLSAICFELSQIDLYDCFERNRTHLV